MTQKSFPPHDPRGGGHYDFYAACLWQVDAYQNILKLRCRLLAFTSYQAFLKNKKRSETSLHALFSVQFLKKNISLVIFY